MCVGMKVSVRVFAARGRKALLEKKNGCEHRPPAMHNRLDDLRALVRGDDLRNRREDRQGPSSETLREVGVAIKGRLRGTNTNLVGDRGV